MKPWAYKEFKLGDLFDIKGIKQAKSQSLIPTINSGIPYVVQSTVNNMVSRNVDRQWLIENNEPPVQGNVLVLGVTLPAISYQPYEFGASQVITARANFLSEKIGLYFVALLKKQMLRFSYSHKPGIKIYKETIVSLPVTETGDIDFAYMESRIREMEESRIREMETYLKVSGFENCELTEEETKALDSFNNKRVGTFNIGSLYEKVELQNKTFDKRKDSRPIPDSQYCIPLVNAKHGNNGIMYYGDPNIFDSVEMTIDIVQNGAVATGDVYPQPQRTGVLWDAYLIRASHHQDNVETLIYISTAIAKSIKLKYTYDNKAYWEQVKEELITLPITTSGSIDYQFMETYIRAIEKLTIQKVKDWRNKEIATTKNIVEDDTNGISLQPQNKPKQYDIYGNNIPKMVAEDIFIYSSIPIDLPNTKRNELITNKLDLVLMYAIGSVARHKTETAGKIAFGIKESILNNEQIAAYNSIKYLMFHYWSNPMAYQLTKEPILVDKETVPSDYLVRLDKDAVKYLLLEYNPLYSADLGDVNILKTQRRGEIRYLPFVTTLESIKNE